MSDPEKFDSIRVEYSNWIEPRLFQQTLQHLREDDVDIEVEAFGICGTYTPAASGNWARLYVPMEVGHEVIGKIAAIGPGVTKFKIGDRVGVSAQCDLCGQCFRCHEGNKNYCKANIATFFGGSNETNTPTQGGYSNFVRLIPDLPLRFQIHYPVPPRYRCHVVHPNSVH